MDDNYGGNFQTRIEIEKNNRAHRIVFGARFDLTWKKYNDFFFLQRKMSKGSFLYCEEFMRKNKSKNTNRREWYPRDIVRKNIVKK